MMLKDLIPENCRRIAVVGMAKNAGKTVVLNRLISEITDSEEVMGITSTGRDGEEQDLVTLTEKPRIHVPVGTLLGTTEGCLKQGDAKVEILKTTGENTPMGQVVLVRVRQAGFIQIAGPDTNQGVLRIARDLEAHGATKVLVDGAIDRKSSASPGVTDGCILATGAVLHRDPEMVVAKTKHQAELFSIPETKDPEVKRQWSQLVKRGNVGVVGHCGELRMIPVSSAINSGGDLGKSLKKGDRYLLINGSLTDKTLKELTQVTSLYKETPIVMSDATKVFITEKEWKIWKRMGIELEVIHPVKLLAVTINPLAPEGYEFDKRSFKHKMQHALGDIPVVDSMEEGGLD